MKKNKENKINEKRTILEALKQLQKIEKKILFVVNNKDRVTGSLTDGDLRRSLIKNIDLKSHVFKIMNDKPYLIYEKNQKKININGDKLKILKYAAIVDKNKKYISISALENIEENINDVIIMAGGKGKRLYPLTKDFPKPLIKIYDKPHLFELIERLISQKFVNISVSVNFYSEKIISSLGWAKNIANIKFIKEKNFLGTAGSISLLKKTNDQPVIVINGDVITNLDLNSLLHYHNQRKAEITICVKKSFTQIPFAVVKEKNNKVFELIEKPTEINLYNTGIYVLNPKIIKKFIIKNKRLDMPDLINNVIKKNHKVLSFYMYEDWLDYGTKETLIKLNKNFKKNFD
jgi:dTDP-glucose pyrophosphorylase